jgi:hypothetical protein
MFESEAAALRDGRRPCGLGVVDIYSRREQEIQSTDHPQLEMSRNINSNQWNVENDPE